VNVFIKKNILSYLLIGTDKNKKKSGERDSRRRISLPDNLENKCQTLKKNKTKHYTIGKTLSFGLSGLDFERLRYLAQELEVHRDHSPPVCVLRRISLSLSLFLSLKCKSFMLHLHHISLF
jgi:hypothetical protein